MAPRDERRAVWRHTLPLILLVVIISGCLNSVPVMVEQPPATENGWAPSDLRVLDPLTYETGPKRPEREPAIAINPTDPLNVIAVNTEEVQTPRYESWLRFFTSDDGGNNWTEVRV